jgi:ribosomal protein S27AE
MSNADWWSRQLNGNNPVPQGRPNIAPMAPPSQVPMSPMPTFQSPSPNPAERAQSARQNDSCPDCGSGNFFAIQNAAARGYDCGYPISQSGSRLGNLTGAHVEGAAQQASGNNSQSNWNPRQIIGHIGE